MGTQKYEGRLLLCVGGHHDGEYHRLPQGEGCISLCWAEPVSLTSQMYGHALGAVATASLLVERYELLTWADANTFLHHFLVLNGDTQLLIAYLATKGLPAWITPS